MIELSKYAEGDEAMVVLGGQLAEAMKLESALVTMFLQGDLGAGKTTLSRGIVQGFGHKGAVKSPTYTLLEPYELTEKNVYHFDLYRLTDPEEIEYLGVRECFQDGAVCLVEWPEKGDGFLPEVDIDVQINITEVGRELVLKACTVRGERILEVLQ